MVNIKSLKIKIIPVVCYFTSKQVFLSNMLSRIVVDCKTTSLQLTKVFTCVTSNKKCQWRSAVVLVQQFSQKTNKSIQGIYAWCSKCFALLILMVLVSSFFPSFNSLHIS